MSTRTVALLSALFAVLGAVITFLSISPDRAQLNADEITASSEAGEPKKVVARKLNIRRCPATSCRVVGQLSGGQTVAVTTQLPNWSQLALDGGQTGWVASRFLAEPRGPALKVHSNGTWAYANVDGTHTAAYLNDPTFSFAFFCSERDRQLAFSIDTSAWFAQVPQLHQGIVFYQTDGPEALLFEITIDPKVEGRSFATDSDAISELAQNIVGAESVHLDIISPYTAVIRQTVSLVGFAPAIDRALRPCDVDVAPEITLPASFIAKTMSLTGKHRDAWLGFLHEVVGSSIVAQATLTGRGGWPRPEKEGYTFEDFKSEFERLHPSSRVAIIENDDVQNLLRLFSEEWQVKPETE